MKEIKLDDYFEKSEFKGQACSYPEEIAETLRINERMREVEKDYKYKAVKSWQMARRLHLRGRC